MSKQSNIKISISQSGSLLLLPPSLVLVNPNARDVGSRDKIRPLWRHYYQNTQAIIWLVDCSDHVGIEEVSYELQKMLREDDLRDAVFLIMANKQDLPNAMSVATITEKLCLNEVMGQRKWYIQAACATSGDGSFLVLSSFIQ